MNISMWMIADWLINYDISVSIKDGTCHLKNIRILTENALLRQSKSTILVCPAKEYFASGDGVMCLNGADYILIKSEDVDEVYNVVAEALDYYDEMDSKIKDAAVQKNNLSSLIEYAAQIFHNPVFIADAGNRALGTTLAAEEQSRHHELLQADNPFLQVPIQQEINDILKGTQHIRHPFLKKTKNFPYPVLLRNLHDQDEHIGWVMLWQQKCVISKGQEQLLDYFAGQVEIWIKNQPEIDVLQKTDIFRNLLENRGLEDQSLRLYMNALGWKENDQKILLCMLPATAEDWNPKYLINLINLHCPYGYLMIHENSIVAVWNTTKYPQGRKWEELRPVLDIVSLCAGVSAEFTNILELRRYYLQGKIALKYGKHTTGAINLIADYMEAYLQEMIRSHIAVDLFRDQMNILVEYDRKHETEYVKTLYEYLRHERNQTKTAAYLHLHRNSLLKRLSKIDDLTGFNLDDEKVRLQLWVSFMMLER